MLVLFLLLVIAAMALGILGVVVKGLLYLLFTGIGVLLVAFFLGALWMRRRTRRRRHARLSLRAALHTCARKAAGHNPSLLPAALPWRGHHRGE